MHDRRASTEARLSRTLRERVRPAVHPLRLPLDVAVWEAPGEPVPVADALGADHTPTSVGEPWGRPWSTTWFRLRGTVPPAWAGRHVEIHADLGFDRSSVGFQAEGLAYTADGAALKGLNPYSDWIPVAAPALGGEDIDLHIEAAANLSVIGTPGEGGFDFRPSPEGDRLTSSGEPLYRTAAFDLVVVDDEVWELVQDLEVLSELMAELGDRDPRRAEILRAVERCLDALDPEQVGPTAPAARACLRSVLAAPAHASAHRLSAVGHAHIDSAWLWPVRETVRKVARTCANVVDLLDSDPDFVFAMSQAQQYAWIKEHRPEVYARVKEKVAEGRFVPVGGMWVESDSNLTGGESLVRQFTHGKRFFLDEFGIEPREVWLPDSFGYSAALPQIMRLAGAEWFLTQKISWNTVNRFPHHTFRWEGIDGTRMFTHFPPADMYNSEVKGAEVHHAARNFAEQGEARHSLLPYGHGDGGGGPTREMLARVRRLRDLEGSPRVDFDSPASFHAKALAEYPQPPVWSGELYLESHRGTYTSQARTKQGNRRSEHLLREAELWAATAAVRRAAPYPYEALDRIWKTVLLQQFHDILPGSSIAWVHREAEEQYARAAAELERLIAGSLSVLTEDGDPATELVANASPHARAGVPALGVAPTAAATGPVTVTSDDGLVTLDNGLLRVRVDGRGLVVSVHDHRAGREVVAPGAPANLLQLHRDTPNQWDAWDVDEFYRNSVTDLTDVDGLTVHGAGTDSAEVRVERRFGASTVVQTIALRAGAARVDFTAELDWHERQKLLKAAFPLDVQADRSAAEIQFGHVFRPTHANTTWDAAKFEICAHRWLHVAEPGYGIALVNEATYGHDVTRDDRAVGKGVVTTVRLSLLRAPLSPDPEADQGRHVLRYALAPGADIADAVREGYHANLPERRLSGTPVVPLVSVDHPAVVIEAVKLADDGSGDVVVRLYEALGGRASTHLDAAFQVVRIAETDLLERPAADGATADGDRFPVELGPFQILTLRLYRPDSPHEVK
ncbi:alpha-mannosidase [Streptomyces sp. NBC_00370]|uniref:alpha-mannosidase n=1 Tax=Streptomyces sp. NBC_00370 TaxID=2975728 RepID=UPI002E27741D